MIIVLDMGNFLFLGNIGAGEILIIALVVLLFFGGRKIPELMKGLGKGVKSFKEGMSDVERNIDLDSAPASGRQNRSVPTKDAAQSAQQPSKGDTADNQ